MHYENTNFDAHNFPIISVIVPVYNCEDYVEYCLESIIGQTYCNLEIIVINDGSTDSSGNICNRFLSDRRVTVLHTENYGLSYARNLGCNKSSGDFILFVDSDDFIQEDTIECLLYVQEKTSSDIVISDYRRVECHEIQEGSEDHNYKTICSEDAISKLFGSLHDVFEYGTAWGKLINKRLVLRYPFPVGKLWEDVFVMYKIYDAAESIAVVESVKYNYFKNVHGITSRPFSRKNLDYLEGMKKRLIFLEKKYPRLVSSAKKTFAEKCNELSAKAIAVGNKQLSDEIRNYLLF